MLTASTSRALAALALAPCLSAQAMFQPTPIRGILPEGVTVRARGTTFADLDGDGLTDILNGEALLLGRATGPTLFEDVTETHWPHPETGWWDTKAVDIDGDGDLDVFTASDEGVLAFLNDGAGVFVNEPIGAVSAATLAKHIELFDADGDGDLDLFVARALGTYTSAWLFPEPNYFFRNEGGGNFVDATSQIPSDADFTRTMASGDIDGDGDIDLWLGRGAGVDGNPGNPDRLLLNDGTGNFTLAPATQLPSTTAKTTLGVTLVDVDADGDLDALAEVEIFAPFFGAPPQPDSTLWINDGSGNFTDASLTQLTDVSTTSDAIGDLDGDGNVDFFLNGVVLNDGTGAFTRISEVAVGTPARLVDLDADGDLDVFGPRVLLQDAAGGFYAPDFDPTPVITLADVNSDDTVDYVVDTRGRLTTPEAIAAYENIWTIDYDGDGDRDLISNAFLYTNDGTDTFLGIAGPGFGSATFGDVNGDGFEDVVTHARISSPFSGPPTDPSYTPRVLLSDGLGGFQDLGLFPTDPDPAWSADLGDVDGDGDLDLLLGGGYVQSGFMTVWTPSRLYINDGAGVFSIAAPGWISPGTGDAFAASTTLADWDHDGDVDLVLGNTDQFIWAFSENATLFVNDGTGHFTYASDRFLTPTQGVPHAGDTVVVDIDDDGDLDLVPSVGAWFVGGIGPNWINDGTGYFTANFDNPAGLPFDADGDGDLDFGTAYVNHKRHLDAPELARLGQPYRLRVHTRETAGATLAVPIVGFAAADLPTPFGRFGIDPTDAFALPAVTLPLAGGSADVTMTVPSDPTIADWRIWFQALIVDVSPLPTTPRLTNVVVETLLP